MDDLALRRTHWANERTWLAYVRTSGAGLVASFTAYRFFHVPEVAVGLGVLSGVVGVVGTVLFIARWKAIR